MNRALLAALIPLLLLPANGNGHRAAPPSVPLWTAWTVPICPGGRVPVTPNVRLDQVRGGEFVAAEEASAQRTRDRPGVCLGLATHR